MIGCSKENGKNYERNTFEQKKKKLGFNFNLKKFRVIANLPLNNWALLLTVSVGPLLLGFT